LKTSQGKKVAIDSDVKTTVAETHRVLMAELTWARLYTKTMHKLLGSISVTLKRNRMISVRPEIKKAAEKLHDQLQSANRTVTEISDHAGVRPVSS
jgi:hypothetical protein